MARHHTAEQIIVRFREAEAALGGGATIGQVCQKLGVSEQTYYRWKNQYGGLKADDAKRLKELEAENARLKRVVGVPTSVGRHLTLDKQLLQEVLAKKSSAPPSCGPRCAT